MTQKKYNNLNLNISAESNGYKCYLHNIPCSFFYCKNVFLAYLFGDVSHFFINKKICEFTV